METEFAKILFLIYKKTMQNNNHVIEVGRGTPKAEAFESWLIEQGYEIDKSKSNHSFVDGDDILFNKDAINVWLELWDEFLGSSGV